MNAHKPLCTTVVAKLKVFARILAQVNLRLVLRVANRLAFEHPRIHEVMVSPPMPPPHTLIPNTPTAGVYK